MLDLSLRQCRHLELKGLHYHGGLGSCEGLLQLHAFGTEGSGAPFGLARLHALEFLDLLESLCLMPSTEDCSRLVEVLVQRVGSEEAETALEVRRHAKELHGAILQLGFDDLELHGISLGQLVRLLIYWGNLNLLIVFLLVALGLRWLVGSIVECLKETLRQGRVAAIMVFLALTSAHALS